MYRHTLGDSIKFDTLIYLEKDPSMNIGLNVSGNYMIFNRGNFNSSENFFLKRKTPYQLFQRFEPIEKGINYSLTHYKKEDYFYIQTNWNAPNGKFMRTPTKSTKKSEWEEIIPHNEKIILNGVSVKKNYFIASEIEKGDKQIRIIDRKTKESYHIEIDKQVYELGFRSFDYDSTFIRYGYSSLNQLIRQEDRLNWKTGILLLGEE